MSDEFDEQPAPHPERASFDLYSELLQLPDGPRPPHLYQLLGIELFCPHPEQIEHAVRRQFRKLKPYEEHTNREFRERVQDILSHIASARAVLTNRAEKAAYDTELAEALGIDRDYLLRERTAARPPEYRLTVIAGPGRAGMWLDLLPDRVIRVGSDAESTLCLPSARMGPVHAQLELVDDDWLIRSARAEHVVLVNGHRCHEFVLVDGDDVDAGGYRLRFARINVPPSASEELPPPLSLIIREGPSIPDPVFNAVPPTSILIGHCETALWQLPDRLVSRHHARIESAGAAWTIGDLRSTNGVLLNGDRVVKSAIDHRDKVVIGRFEIQVNLRR